MAEQADPAARWDDAYALGDTSRSWFQREPALSLRMLDARCGDHDPERRRSGRMVATQVTDGLHDDIRGQEPETDRHGPMPLDAIPGPVAVECSPALMSQSLVASGRSRSCPRAGCRVPGSPGRAPRGGVLRSLRRRLPSPPHWRRA